MDYPSDPSVGLVAGKFTDGDPAGGVPASLDRATEMNAVYDELIALIAGSGQSADELALNQVLEGVRRLAGAHVTTITNADSPYTLSLADAGMIEVDASGGNVIINLPSAAELAAVQYVFVRTDGSANTVTINADGAEAVGGAASISLATGDVRKVKSNGVGEFHLEADNAYASQTVRGLVELATDAEAQDGADPSRVLTPANLNAATLGRGQSQQDLKASRSLGVIYTNTTGQPIFLSVSVARGASGEVVIWGDIDSNGPLAIGLSYSGSVNSKVTGHMIVGPGETYELTCSVSVVIAEWVERRA